MSTVLITGASSLPGYRTAMAFLKRGYKVVGTHLTHEIPIEDPNFFKARVDITDLDSLRRVFENHRPLAVIHIAAYGDVDGCERDKSLAWRINVVGTLNVMRLAAKYCKYALYLSTDYVFDGKKGGYAEDDPPCPINYYGLTKLGGEIATLSSPLDSAVVRASSIYGFGPGRKNFAKFLVEKLSAGEEVKALVDQYTTPTQATLLAESILEIVERGLTGIFHIVGEKMSRYEFAIKVAETLGYDPSLIKEITMDEFRWFAPRPRDSSLLCEKTRNILKTDFHTTQRAMEVLRGERT